MSGIFSTFRVTASALTAQRLRMDVISNNVANAETTRTADGGAYQRQQVYFMAKQSESGILPQIKAAAKRQIQAPGKGVQVSSIIADDSPGNKVYDPNHPDADEEGFVTYPNVAVSMEMVDLMQASRAYEANLQVVKTARTMVEQALSISR